MKKENFVAAVVLAIALVFVAAGILRGEANAVFQKSVKICLECIGIG